MSKSIHNDTSGNKEGHKEVVGSHSKSINAEHGPKAGAMSQLETGISNLGLQHHNSNTKKDDNGNLLRLEQGDLSELDIEKVKEVSLSNGKDTNKYEGEKTEAVKMDAPVRREDASAYKPMGVVLILGGDHSNSQHSINAAVTDGSKNHANNKFVSTKAHGKAKTNTESLTGDFTSDEHSNELKGNEENPITSRNKSSATAHIFPVQGTRTFGEAGAADRADTAQASGHHRLHASFDIELLETDKPTRLKISTRIQLSGDVEDVEIDQNNECHFGSASTGAITALKAESSQVVQAAEGSDTAKEEDATKAPPAMILAEDHAHTSSPDPGEGTLENEDFPAPEEATVSEHVADFMEVDDDQTVQNGKAAINVNVGWLEKIRNLFNV